MAVSDQEIDQLYAARYRLDQLFQNSPEFQDSLENSSTVNSPSAMSHKSHRSHRTHRSHRSDRSHRSHRSDRSHSQVRTSRQKDDHNPNPEGVRSPKGSLRRRKHEASPSGASSPHWPQDDGLQKNNCEGNSPKVDPVPARRPQPLFQPGFSYIYPNVDGNAPVDKHPVRRYSFLGPSTKLLSDTALPFKGKLEYFDRLSRGSTPEPAAPFSQSHRRVASTHITTAPTHYCDNKNKPQADRNSARFELARVQQAKPPDSPSSRSTRALDENPHFSKNVDGSTSPVPKRSPHENSTASPAPSLQAELDERLLKRHKCLPGAWKLVMPTNEASPVHRRQMLLQVSYKENKDSPHPSPATSVSLRVCKDNCGDDQSSDATGGNLSRISTFAEIKKNEQDSRHEREYRSQSFNVPGENGRPSGRRDSERTARKSSQEPKSNLQRHENSPMGHIARKSLAVGQAKISDSVNQITESMSQLRRTLSKGVGRSLTRSFSKSISKSLARKYKRQFNDDPDASFRREQKNKPTLSDTFSTLRRSQGMNPNRTHYQALFGDACDRDRERKGAETNSISDIHRFFHSHDTEGDSRSQKSYKSSSLPHPVDASVREAVSLREKHPEKFWTFTTSVVLPDYEPKRGMIPHAQFHN
ncbi:serine/arginine repetitive matrix protein 4-like [Procambarus clarkii]|uniref:serine/arginine repetitive matrix protein 4-like n=1 Tax=Procambarus clarkii TaxID=6728 RepID=UPI0037438E80